MMTSASITHGSSLIACDVLQQGEPDTAQLAQTVADEDLGLPHLLRLRGRGGPLGYRSETDLALVVAQIYGLPSCSARRGLHGLQVVAVSLPLFAVILALLFRV